MIRLGEHGSSKWCRVVPSLLEPWNYPANTFYMGEVVQVKSNDGAKDLEEGRQGVILSKESSAIYKIAWIKDAPEESPKALEPELLLR